MDPLIQTTFSALDVKVRVARKSSVQKPRPSATASEVAAVKDTVVNKEALRRAGWKVGGQCLLTEIPFLTYDVVSATTPN